MNLYEFREAMHRLVHGEAYFYEFQEIQWKYVEIRCKVI